VLAVIGAMFRSRFSIFVLGSLLAACNAGGLDPKQDPSAEPSVGTADYDWDGLGMRPQRDTRAKLRYLVPAAGYRVTGNHFPRSTPEKLRHSIVFAEGRHEVLSIEVWDNPAGTPLPQWFEQNLAFMRTRDASVREAPNAIEVVHPRSPQALARRAAIFALGGRVLRVTAIDDDDPRVRSLFGRVLSSIAEDGAP
jgi:hypothetical protein